MVSFNLISDKFKLIDEILVITLDKFIDNIRTITDKCITILSY